MSDEGRSVVQLKTIALFLFFPNLYGYTGFCKFTEDDYALTEDDYALTEDDFAHLQMYCLLQMSFRDLSYVQEHGKYHNK